MELPVLLIDLGPLRLAKMTRIAVTTASINIKPAMQIAIAKFLCDIQTASSGFCNYKNYYYHLFVICVCILFCI